jgi:hypothetical protein
MSSEVPGSCPANWLQGKPSTDEALFSILAIERLEPFILRGQAAFGGDIDHDDDLALIGGERLVGTIEQRQGEIGKRGHGAVLCGKTVPG